MKRTNGAIVKNIAIIGTILVGIANLLYLPVNNLHPDEAYYWVWSHNLAWGYFDNSPMVAYVIRFFTSFGNSAFWVRLPALLVWLWLVCFIYWFTKKLYKNSQAGFLALLIGLFVPLLTSGSHIMTHDIPLMFFTSLVFYFLYEAVEEGKKKAWYGVGIFLGFALFSKFQAALLGVIILAMLLFRSSKRHWLTRKEPYWAALISLLMFTPILYWNATHRWAAFAFQFEHGIHRVMKLENLLEFWGGQALIFSLLFFALFYYAAKRTFSWQLRKAPDVFLMYSFLPIFLFFSFTSLTYPALPNWPAIAYLPSIIFLGAQLQRSFEYFGRIRRTLLWIFLIFSFGISTLLLTLVRYPELLISHLNINLPSEQVIANSTYGWSKLGQRVDQAIDQYLPHQKVVPIFGDSYQVAAELQYYVSKPAVFFTTREAHRCHFDYVTMDKIAEFNGQSGILVIKDHLPPSAAKYFQEIALVEHFAVKRFGQQVRDLYIYRFAKLDAPALYEMAANKPLGYPGKYKDPQ